MLVQFIPTSVKRPPPYILRPLFFAAQRWSLIDRFHCALTIRERLHYFRECYYSRWLIQWKLVSSIVPLLEFLVSSSGTRGPWTSVYLLVQNSLSSSNGAARTSGYIELETPPLDRNNSNLLELILIIRRFISKVQIYLYLL